MDGKFGAKTEEALKLFQKRNGLTQDGIASQDLQLKLYEDTPKDTRGYRQYVRTVPPVAGAVIREKSKGEPVTKLQTRLKELGYYEGDPTGVCDENTVAAIKLFEGKHGLVADGEMSAADQQVLYGATAMEASVVVTPSPTPTVKPPTKTLRPGDKDEGGQAPPAAPQGSGLLHGQHHRRIQRRHHRGRQGLPEEKLPGAGRRAGPHHPHGALRRERHLRGAHGHSRLHARAHHDAPHAGERDRHSRGEHGARWFAGCRRACRSWGIIPPAWTACI